MSGIKRCGVDGLCCEEHNVPQVAGCGCVCHESAHPSGFSARAGTLARDRAIDAVDKAADDAWKIKAWEAILYVARVRQRFTTDAVWYMLQEWGVPPPREPRAMGPMVVRGMREEIFGATGERKRSERVGCHRRPIDVYLSKIYVADYHQRAGDVR
jgi:hypothetical protein